jgi:hypothetical protein
MLHLQYGGVRIKKIFRTGTNAKDYCASDSTKKKRRVHLIIQWIGGTNKTLGEVQSAVENGTPRGMASSFCTHIRGHPNKLVYILGTTQRSYELDSTTTELYSHFLI